MTEPNGHIAAVLELDRKLKRAIRRSTPGLWQDVNLPIAMIRTLLAIDEHESGTPGQIAQAMGVGRSSLSGILDRLESEGFLSRAINPDDRRSFLLSLTQQGRELVYRVDGHRRELLRCALERLETSHLAALEQGLTALLAEMERELEGESDLSQSVS